MENNISTNKFYDELISLVSDHSGELHAIEAQIKKNKILVTSAAGVGGLMAILSVILTGMQFYNRNEAFNHQQNLIRYLGAENETDVNVVQLEKSQVDAQLAAEQYGLYTQLANTLLTIGALPMGYALNLILSLSQNDQQYHQSWSRFHAKMVDLLVKYESLLGVNDNYSSFVHFDDFLVRVNSIKKVEDKITALNRLTSDLKNALADLEKLKADIGKENNFSQAKILLNEPWIAKTVEANIQRIKLHLVKASRLLYQEQSQSPSKGSSHEANEDHGVGLDEASGPPAASREGEASLLLSSGDGGASSAEVGGSKLEPTASSSRGLKQRANQGAE